MLLPPWALILQLLDFSQPMPYDIVHVFAPLCLAMVPFLPLFYIRNVKIYVSYHVFLQFYEKVYLGSMCFRDFYRPVIESLFAFFYFIPLVLWAEVVGIPSKTADDMVFKYSHRIHIMKSGLDTTIFKPSLNSEKPWSHLVRTQGPVLVYVGRLADEKNIDFLIQAMASPKLQSFTLILVGNGPSRQRLEKLAEKVVGKDSVFYQDKLLDSAYIADEEFTHRPCTPSIVFTGMIHSEELVASHYAHADVFVSASASETFGFTVAEAMACGTPAVVVRAGAFESVYQCIDDWMFQEKSIENYVDNIVHVVSLGDKARSKARDIALENFGVSRAIDDLLATYIHLVDETLSTKKNQ